MLKRAHLFYLGYTTKQIQHLMSHVILGAQ